MNTTKYAVEFVEPGDQFIEPGSEIVVNDSGVEVKAGHLGQGKWVSWIPYYENTYKESKPEPRRAIAMNKYVSAGAIQDYYYE